METPVLFLIFNRPETTRIVFSAIREARPAKLYIAADGPRAGKTGEKERCIEARSIINQIDWPCEVKTLFRQENLGCKLAISGAINWFFEKEEEGIILEDDCLPDGSFFKYCEEMLDLYRDDENIFMISGNNFYSESINSKWPTHGFVRIPHIWGWATWGRAWKRYSLEMDGLESYLKSEAFNKYWKKRVYRQFWSEMFNQTVKGEIDTWDYSWAYTLFINNGLSVAPRYNLVTNIGFGLGDRTLDKRDKRSRMAISPMSFPIIKSKSLVRDENADNYDMDHHCANLYALKKFLTKFKIFRLVKEGMVMFIKSK
ncbi:MAG: hypothetical protein ACM3PZ_04030 [Bacillota bacterium]